MSSRETMEFDVLIIGAGPAGLSAAIRLAQLNKEHNNELSIAVLEKGAAVGSHLLSGAVLEPRALDELIPDWQHVNPPPHTEVTSDEFYYLNDSKHYRLPTTKALNNRFNFIISLDNFAKWLADRAESMGVSIFPGFAAAEVLYNDDHSEVKGVITGDMGLDKQGERTDRFQAGIEIHAKQTIFAEGCRGSLSQKLMQHFNLREECDPQTYGIGVKELWQVSDDKFKKGSVTHTVGWPLDSKTYGGSFMYHFDDNRVSIGIVIGLDYRNPTLDPFQELQRMKLHPLFKNVLEGGKCIGYGARALNEGGWQSIPQLTFPGGLLVGCAAGFMNVSKIKGNHTAMKSGMLAAEAVFHHLNQVTHIRNEITQYTTMIQQSWIDDELYKARNIRPSFHKGTWYGLVYSAIDQLILRGNAPWTFRNHADHLSLKPIDQIQKIEYPKPDGTLTFSKLNQLYLSGTNHNHDQKSHLKIKDADITVNVNINKYGSPESYYCPAGVYEVISDEQGNKKLQINFQNCLHCKTCDIKDPTQNIEWTAPEGGDGPNYQDM